VIWKRVKSGEGDGGRVYVSREGTDALGRLCGGDDEGTC
jgi:putative component of toxin-antitoxin plasmid stabilization module